jgi:hypothetical protein
LVGLQLLLLARSSVKQPYEKWMIVRNSEELEPFFA